MSDVADDVAHVATGWAAFSLVLLLAACAAVATWARRTDRTERAAVLVFLALVALAGVVVLTLLRDGVPHGFGVGGMTWSSSGWRRLSYDPLGSTQIVLNALLFVPVGLFWTVLTRRPWRVLGFLAALSVAIECLQGLTGAGAPDIADIAANTAGATLGTCAGTTWLWGRPGSTDHRRPTRRQLVRATAVVTSLTVASVVALNVGASHRQRVLEQELTARFAGTDLAQFAKWEHEDRLTEKVFGAVSVDSDGTEYRADSVVVRYPASFFGLRRCGFVEWRPADVEIRGGSGRTCSTLLATTATSQVGS